MEGEVLVFKVFPLDRVQQCCTLLRNAFLSGSFPVSGGGLQDFLPGQSSSSSSHFPAGIPKVLDGPGEGVFRTFSHSQKSAKLGPHSGLELSADFTSSTLAPQLAGSSWYDVEREQARGRFDDSSGRFNWYLVNTDHSQWEPPWEHRT